jgi:two-component system sensor kinase FixL
MLESGRTDVDTGGQSLGERLRRADLQLAENRRALDLLRSELRHVAHLNEFGQLVSVLAHEVSQPLTAIHCYLRGGLRLLDRGEAGEFRAAVVQAAGQSERAIEIVRRLRDLLRNGHCELRPEKLPELVEEACALVLSGVALQAVDLRLNLDPRGTLVLIDRIQIQQVLVNLIRNAVEAMAKVVPRVLIITSAPAPQGGLLITVADTGPGIAPEIRARLFQPFVTSKAGGMGVGLSICRMIAEAHGGSLRAEDRAGGGTVFQLIVPTVQ